MFGFPLIDHDENVDLGRSFIQNRPTPRLLCGAPKTFVKTGEKKALVKNEQLTINGVDIQTEGHNS